jgi:glycine/D-amino acid oxidase-like deaminating enzyme
MGSFIIRKLKEVLSMGAQVNVDVAIVGGGIAGLWLLNRLKQQGYSAVLFEKAYLGGGQTIRSQGIIHGGAKYALKGTTKAAESIKKMPAVWRDCLSGEGEIDLSQTKCLSENQYLWTDNALLSKLTGYFAGRVMKDRMVKLQSDDFPEVFSVPEFHGSVYQLDEPVLDVPSLVRALIKPVKESIVGFDWLQAELQLDDGGIASATLGQGADTVELKAKHYVLTAGEGNAALLETMGLSAPAMQTRPLHMAYVKGRLPHLYAHRLQNGSRPRITITSHALSGGNTAWYLGGELAEKGVAKSRPEQVAAARAELEALLPWVDLSDTKWNSFMVNRAEMASRGKRPDTPSWERKGNITAAWSTKLAFAPLLAKEIISDALIDVFPSNKQNIKGFESFAKPQIAEAVWEH